MADDELYQCSREKRRRVDTATEVGQAAAAASTSQEAPVEMRLINFDLVLNESLTMFRAFNRREPPGSVAITLYSPVPAAGSPEADRNFSLYRSKVLSEVTNAATARPETLFNLQHAFSYDGDSAFFVDVDLGFAIPIVSVEIKDCLNLGSVTAIHAGLNCLGNHNHWSFSHWQPIWSRQIDAPCKKNGTSSAAIVVPEEASSVSVGVLRFVINFSAKDAFLTDFTSYVRMSSTVSLSQSFAIPLTARQVTSIESFPSEFSEQLPARALKIIVTSLQGPERMKLLISLSGTCRRFREILRDPVLFSVVDFKVVPPCYFSPALLNFVAERAAGLRHLRVSWQPHLPDGVSFSKFLRRLPPTLTSFIAEACPFVDDKILKTLSESQPNLRTLDLSRCRAISADAFRFILSFTKLRRLSLSCTNVGDRPLCEIIENLAFLEVLNISALSTYEDSRAFKIDSSVSSLLQCLANSRIAANLIALNINQAQVDLEAFTAFVKLSKNMQEFMSIQPDIHRSNWNSTIFSEMASSWLHLRRLSVSELPYRKCLTTESFMQLATQLTDLEHLLVVPSEVTAETVRSAFSGNAKLNCVVLAGKKISPDQLVTLREEFPNRRLTYVDFRPSWYADSDDESSSSNSDDSDSSNSSDDSDSNDSFGGSGDSTDSDESKSDLERFQQETNASLTTLVTSIRDMTNSVDNVRTLLDNLLAKKNFIKRKTLIAEIRFAMATAIYLKRLDVLSMLVERCPTRELPDVLAGDSPLLCFAIKRHYVDAVRFLLDSGAPTNPERAMSALGTVVTTLMDIFDEDTYDDTMLATFIEISELLFSRNANPLQFHPDEKGTNILHYTAYIAGHSPELAALFIEKTPGAAYFSQEFFSAETNNGPTPIAAVFDMIDISDEPQLVNNNFKHALLPLLRNGAPYLPDTAFSTSMLSEIVALDHAFSKTFWGRPYVLAQVLIEARRTSALNVAALTKASSPRRRRPTWISDDENSGSSDEENDENRMDDGIDGVWDEEMGDLLKPFANFVRSQFPRPLQAQCRTAIHRSLPCGPTRMKAVTELDLPNSLTSYLSFEEFGMVEKAK